ncbi:MULTISPECIES: PIN-like domain-containing protein [unclassified Microcoleus]|uniref:PIN-like domain-containing protein n=1 Tax=unclassified Microcoleus TaxID=2642155 RepID=UPI002FD1F263
MKDLFPGYYSLSEQDYLELWSKCTFIFDTNVLLDFYEYNNETRQEYFTVLETIKDRLWIPHQVALEYHKNRITRIIQVESKFDTAKSDLDKIANETTKKLFENFNFRGLPPEVLQELTEDVKRVFDTFWDKLTSCSEELIQINGTDQIRDKITDLFQEKIGESPTNQEELAQIYLEGEKRYKICRPPGFLDRDKDKINNCYTHKGLVFQRQYGDLILWKQLLKQVKSKSLSHIIFITRDNKDDWWRKGGKKTIGPHPELVEEILDAGASMFHMYWPDRFLHFAKKYLQQEIKEESIQQVEEVSVSNSLSEPELDDNFSRQLSAIDSYGLSNIERLIASNNPLSNIERLVAAANNPLSNIANLPKQSVMDATQLINTDKYGLRNNIAVASIMAEQNRFMASVNQFVENNNRTIERMKKQAAIPKQSIPDANGGRDIESSQIEPSED